MFTRWEMFVYPIWWTNKAIFNWFDLRTTSTPSIGLFPSTQYYISAADTPEQQQLSPETVYTLRTCFNSFVHGGFVASDVNTAEGCLVACTSAVECKAFDYDFNLDMCVLHTSATACQRHSRKDRCTHYQLKQCGEYIFPIFIYFW